MTSRINITLPYETVSELKKYAPERGVSRFLAEAAREKIDRIKKEKALNRLLAAPPSLLSFGNSQRYIRNLRRLDERRTRRLGL